MIKRIVKLSVRPEESKTFIDLFNGSKKHILSMKGCQGLELLFEEKTGIFFTFSTWENEACLEAYRDSEVFKGIWGKVRPLFNERAEAWTVTHEG